VTRPLLVVLAVACGVAVANVYFPQATTPLIAEGLGVSPGSAALVATTTQLGYAVGIALLVPLGDRLPHRPLVATLLAVTGLALLAAGLAPGLPVLIGAAIVIGIATVVPQVIIPMAAGLVDQHRRGHVTGLLLSGLLTGILLARAFGGMLGERLGWRAPYLVAAALSVLVAVVLTMMIPTTTPPSRERYPALVAASFRLLLREPQLRRSCLYQATLFGGFTAAWTSLTLLVTGPIYGLDAGAVGLVALVGVASAFCTSAAGRRVDRRGPDAVNLVCFVAAIAAAAVLAVGQAGGVVGLVALVAGMLLLDTSVQSGQVANQARIFALRPEIRSRLNTAYMTCAFIGGSAGSLLGVQAFLHWGWLAVCGLVAALAVLALLRHVRSTQPAMV
jgi:predicted MFS family arabinose efflux permease